MWYHRQEYSAFVVIHSFIYWEDEGAGTVVPFTAIKSHCPAVGMTTKVKCGGGEHDGKIIALG